MSIIGKFPEHDTSQTVYFKFMSKNNGNFKFLDNIVSLKYLKLYHGYYYKI